MKYKLLRLIIILIVISQFTIPVLAETTAIVNVIMVPEYSGGINNFTITYVTDTHMHLTWNLGGDAANIMIRAKYGEYPAGTSDPNVAPTDGYFVYYGSGDKTDDTSMNFDQNPGFLYYTAVAQRADGTWFTGIVTGGKESIKLLLLAFIALFIGLIVVNVMARNSFIPIKMIAAFAWVIPFVWITTSPPTPFTAGSQLNTVMLVIISGAFLISLFAAFRRPLQMGSSFMDKNGQQKNESYEKNGWHIPVWMNPNRETEEERQNREAAFQFNNRNSAYRQRFHRALNPDDRRRR